MMDIGLRPVPDGHAAREALGAPVATVADATRAFVRKAEAWIAYGPADAPSWFITAGPGSPMFRPQDVEGAAITAAGLSGGLGACTDLFGPPPPAWTPDGTTAVPVTGGHRTAYAYTVTGRNGPVAVVAAVVPVGTLPPDPVWI